MYYYVSSASVVSIIINARFSPLAGQPKRMLKNSLAHSAFRPCLKNGIISAFFG